jgi:hypothetical protein
MWRFSDDLADTKMIQGTFDRLSDNYDEMKDIVESDEKFEDC